MLQMLKVKNFAIVEDLTVEFEPGLNVITGETGAGKSILVNALSLVLGERADRQMIRSGTDRCTVQARFELPDSARIDAALEGLGLEPCDADGLLLQRTVAGSGTGKTFINNAPATLQALKRVGDLLVDLHGPHDHQSLLQPDFQRNLLDAYGPCTRQRAAYEQGYRALIEAHASKRALQQDGSLDLETQRDMLAYQIGEIEEAELTESDEISLENEHAVSANAQRILELLEGCRQALTESDANAFDAMSFVQKALDEMAGLTSEAGEWLEEARSIAVRLQELSDSLNGYAQNVDCDPRRLEWLEARMALVHKLKRKYGGSVAAILQRLEEARAQRHALDNREQRLHETDEEIRRCSRRVHELGQALTAARRKSAQRLDGAVLTHLRELGFAHGGFATGLQAAEPGPAGMDEVEFGFAPNAGEAMRPLRKIASSGEISRVMLALKAVLSEQDRIPVLVFDEVDANVGGEMGVAIGEKLARVARAHQTLCITHLPQVAARGTHHLVVVKTVRDGRTRARIEPVAGAAREAEMARMLSGKDITDITVRHARELLKKGACHS